MLILVSVTINFALNGGIISKSKQAAAAMQKAADLEELQLAVISAMDYTTGQVVRDDLVSSLSNGWQVTQSAPYTCTSPSGNVFTVTLDGQITAEGESSGGNTSSDDLAYLRTYIGQNLGDMVIDFSDFIFTDPNITLDESFDGSGETDGNGGIILPIRYKGRVYGLVIDGSDLNIINIINNYTPSSSNENEQGGGETEQPPVASSKLGKYVEYANLTWRVLYDDQTHGLQLITDEAIGSISLAGADFSEARYNYNNAVEILVNACKTETGITTNIRNVGGPEIDTTTMNDTVVFSNLNTFTPNENVTFEDVEGTKNGLKIADTNYEEDIVQLVTLNMLRTSNSSSYWVSSRRVVEGSSYVTFGIYLSESGGFNNSTYESICEVQSSGTGSKYNPSARGVRPVITLSSDALDNVTGLGTSNDPYVISD